MLDERSKADYQPWNHEVFNADRRVRRMTPNARKSYVMLLHEAFFCSTRPYLPDNDEELWVMADCNNREEWDDMRQSVLEMFTPFECDGAKLLVHYRVEKDWDRLLNKRGAISLARKRAAEARWGTPMQIDANECNTDATDAKQVSKEVKVSQVSKASETLSEQLDTNGQGEEMKASKVIPDMCRRILGVKAETYPNVWEEVKGLERAYKGSAVINKFEEWALTKKGEQFARPVSEFLKVADGLLAGTFSLSADPAVVVLIDDLVYHARGVITFDDRDRNAIIAQRNDCADPEILYAFKEFFQKMDKNDAFEVKRAGHKFASTLGQEVRLARRLKAEKAAEQSAADRAREIMVAESVADREARKLAREAEEALVEDVLE